MGTVAGRFTKNDFIIKGEVDERLPRITNGLLAYYPFDGTVHDRMTEFHRDKVITTSRDRSFDFFPSQYNYAGMKFIVSGRVRCDSAVDWTKTTAIGFQYIETNGGNKWPPARRFTLSDIRNKWVDFVVQFTVPTDYLSDIKPWFQIDIAAGTTGYKVTYENVNYLFISDPSYLTNDYTKLNNDFLSIKEYSQNYVPSDFSQTIDPWFAGATATTLDRVMTPYGYGIRMTRDAGDNGNWSVRFNNNTSYKAGETWVWSFKYKTHKGDVDRPFYVGWWISDGDAYRYNLPMTVYPLDEDGWYQVYAPYTFLSDYIVADGATYACGFNTVKSNSIVDFTDIRLEKRNFPSHTADRSSLFKLNYTLPDQYTISCEKRDVFDTKWSKYAITKTSANVFNLYKDGEPVTDLVNRWARIRVKGVGINRNKGYNFPDYNDPISKTYISDPIVDYSRLNEEDSGYYFRTFVYCSADISVDQKYRADNYGGIRINNGNVMSLGGHNADTNPTITINLVAGWNLVEMVWMDGDTGGGFSLNTGTALKLVPEVLYMTAELPADMASNMFWFNEKSNVDIRNLVIYNRVLTTAEIKSVHKPRGISITKTGDVKMIIKEALPYMPTDSFYFPLSVNGSDISNVINPYKTDNLVFDNGWVWVGTAVNNLLKNGSGKDITAENYAPGWDTALHPKALTVQNWSVGYNGAVSSPATGYHAQWVREGLGGPNDPCMKFINKNDEFGFSGRWLGISQSLGILSSVGLAAGSLYSMQWDQRTTDINLAASVGLNYKQADGTSTTQSISGYNGDVDIWESIYSPRQIPANMNVDDYATMYIYGHNVSLSGILWIDNVMVHTKPFKVPFTETTRGKGALEYNLNKSIGLNWNGDWSIVYFKIPMSTHVDTQSGFNIDSLGCNSNSVGGQYMWWGKNNTKNEIDSSTPAAIDPAKYFGNPRMVSLVSKGGTITIKEWDYFGNVHVRTRATPTAANAYVTQYGYDLKLGGWDNGNPANSSFRDLIVSKRAFSDEEVERIFKTRYSSRDNGFYVSGRVLVDPTLM